MLRGCFFLLFFIYTYKTHLGKGWLHVQVFFFCFFLSTPTRRTLARVGCMCGYFFFIYTYKTHFGEGWLHVRVFFLFFLSTPTRRTLVRVGCMCFFCVYTYKTHLVEVWLHVHFFIYPYNTHTGSS